MRRRIAAATAASSSAGRSIVGTAPDILGRYLPSKEKVAFRGGAASRNRRAVPELAEGQEPGLPAPVKRIGLRSLGSFPREDVG
jgi:hypothetical protein